MFQAIGDTVSALGGSQEVFEGIIRALGQIYTKGKLSAEELLQLAERGVPAYEILKEKLGLTADQLANIGSQGIEAKKAIDALVEGMAERFGGNMQKMANTWSGIISNLKDSLSKFLLMVGESGAFRELKKRLKEVQERISKAFDSGEAQKWAQVVGKAIVIFVDGISYSAKILKEVFSIILAISEAIINTTKDLIDLKSQTSDFWSDLAKGIWASFSIGVNKLASIITDLIAEVLKISLDLNAWFQSTLIAPLASAFEWMWQKFKESAVDAVNYVLEKLTDLVNFIAEKIPWIGQGQKFEYKPIIEFKAKSYEEILKEQRENIKKNTQEAKKFIDDLKKAIQGVYKENEEYWKKWERKIQRVSRYLKRTLQKQGKK